MLSAKTTEKMTRFFQSRVAQDWNPSLVHAVKCCQQPLLGIGIFLQLSGGDGVFLLLISGKNTTNKEIVLIMVGVRG